jgi:hypothetical protein
VASNDVRRVRNAPASARTRLARRCTTVSSAAASRDNDTAASPSVVELALATAAQRFYFRGDPSTPERRPTANARRRTATPPAARTRGGRRPPRTSTMIRTWTGTLTLTNIPLGTSSTARAAHQASPRDQPHPPASTDRAQLPPPSRGRHLGAAVRRSRRRQARRPGQLRPGRERPGRRRLPAGTIAMARPAQTRTARAASSSSSTRTPRYARRGRRLHRRRPVTSGSTS